MKMRVFLSMCVMVLFAACGKKEAKPTVTEQARIIEKSGECGQEAITKKPVKVGETGIALPDGSRLCITKDKLEARVELPAGYTFITATDDGKSRPPYATYSCTCSESKNNCQVFYAEEMGFGCLQNSCSGSCTGKFTIQGVGVNRIVSTTNKLDFFSLPEVQKSIWEKCGTIVFPLAGSNPQDLVYLKQQAFGISYYLLVNKNDIPPSLANAEVLSSKASCKCKDTKFCKLMTVDLPMLKGQTSKIKIYLCDGSCNGCELTVD
jgi:hypothetical protein